MANFWYGTSSNKYREYKGGYTSYGGYDATPNITPIYNSTDQNTYVTWNDKRYYNSALLAQPTGDGGTYFVCFILLPTTGYFYKWQRNGSSLITEFNCNTQGSNCYTRINGSFIRNGITVPYMDSVEERSYDTWFGDLPIFTNIADFDAYISEEPIPPYNWQSVPSISGKNGILSLAQIKDEYINEGESVSGASADHFTNLSSENRVDVLIDAALPDPETGGTTVTVKYTIPSLSIGSYTYCKLVAKKSSIPEGPEDGDKIIDIDPSLTSIVVRGLDGLRKYYFVIFIEDDQGNTASSEPKSCETGESVVPPEYQTYINSINGSGFFFKDWTIREVTWYGETVNYPYGEYSYFCFDSTPPAGNRINYNETFTSSVSPISSVYITSSNNTYSYTITANRLQASTREAYALNFRGEVSPIAINAASGGSGEITYNSGTFNSLIDLFGELVTRAKNVNIYVDGVLWSSTSN